MSTLGLLWRMLDLILGGWSHAQDAGWDGDGAIFAIAGGPADGHCG